MFLKESHKRQGAEIHAVLTSYNLPTEQHVHQKTSLSTGSTEALRWSGRKKWVGW